MPDVISGQAAQAAPDPVTMISALLDAEKVVQNQKPETKAEPSAQPEQDADYKAEENAVVEGEDAQPTDAEKPPVAEIPLEQLESIELETTYKSSDGKDVTEKLPIKTLREGYMRQQDYQRKTAEVARQREEVGQKIRQGIESERTQYQQNLQQLQTALVDLVSPELKNVDWNDLANNNQFEYVRLSNRRDQISQALQAISAKQQETRTKAETDQRQLAQETARKTWATLESEIPGWSNDVYQAALKASETLGYTAAETGAWLDPRAIKLMHKAYLYDQLKAGKPAADKKVVAAPAVVIRPGASAPANTQGQKTRQAMERLGKSGKVDDFAAVIASMK